MSVADEWEALDAFLADPAEFPLGEPGPDPEPVAIADQEEATSILRRVARIDRQIAAAESAAESEIDNVRRFLADRTSGPKRYRAMLEHALETWWRTNRPPDIKSMSLPTGTIRLKASGRPAVADLPEELIEGLDGWRSIQVSIDKKAVANEFTPGDPVDPSRPVGTGPGEMPSWEAVLVADAAAVGKVVCLAVNAAGHAHPTLRFLVDSQDRFYMEPAR